MDVTNARQLVFQAIEPGGRELRVYADGTSSGFAEGTRVINHFMADRNAAIGLLVRARDQGLITADLADKILSIWSSADGASEDGPAAKVEALYRAAREARLYPLGSSEGERVTLADLHRYGVARLPSSSGNSGHRTATAPTNEPTQADPACARSSAPPHQTPLDTGTFAGWPEPAGEARRAYLSDLDARFANYPSLPSWPEVERRLGTVTGESCSSPPSSPAGIRARLASCAREAVRALVSWWPGRSKGGPR